MNYQTWSKKKFWLIIFGTFLIGMLIAPRNPVTTKEVIKEVPVEKVVTKEVVKEVPSQFDDSNWRRLKAIDDQAIGVAVDQMDYCAQGFIAISEGDIKTLNSLPAKIQAGTKKVNALTIERQEVLGKLGY